MTTTRDETLTINGVTAPYFWHERIALVLESGGTLKEATRVANEQLQREAVGEYVPGEEKP